MPAGTPVAGGGSSGACSVRLGGPPGAPIFTVWALTSITTRVPSTTSPGRKARGGLPSMDNKATPWPEALKGPATPTRRNREASVATGAASATAGARVNKGDQSAGGTAFSTLTTPAGPAGSAALGLIQGMIQATALAATASHSAKVTNLIHMTCVS